MDSDWAVVRRAPSDAMIEAGAAEVRGALAQLEAGKIERISPQALAEDVLRAALDPAPTAPKGPRP